MARIAVVGAGLGGLVIANALSADHPVAVFEKSRGVGGRMATRYADPYRFDHGAQFFTARTRDFRSFLEPYLEKGIVANWQASFVEMRGSEVTANREWDDSPQHYVAVPGMNSLPQALAEGLRIELNTTVAALVRDKRNWTLRDDGGNDLGRFDWVIVTVPAAQAATLAGTGTSLARFARQVRMLGCYALMLGFRDEIPLPWQAALVRNADISWISVNSSKPGRDSPPTLVVHSTNAWAEAHMEDDSEFVRSHMLAELARVTQLEFSEADHCDLQRWRYANIDAQRGPDHFVDVATGIAACGDWFIRGRIEAAFRSARSLLGRLATVSDL